MDALLSTTAQSRIFSHESAALVHGLPLIGPWPSAPHVLEIRDASRRPPRGVIVHQPMRLPEVVTVGRMSATSPDRTAVDLAASRSLAAGVGAFDHVLRGGRSREDLERMIAASRPFHGVRRAVRALEIANGLAESPLESLSLARIHEGGFPSPLQQIDVEARGSAYRVDFFWPDAGVVGEADGRVKYRTRADLWTEKRREDHLRSLGLSVARWDWDDAWAGAPLFRSLTEAGLTSSPHYAYRSAPNAADRYA